MGRPSKLTPAQWDEIKRRLAYGERQADLAKEFKISPQRIAAMVSEAASEIKNVANQIVTARDALERLPFSEQTSAISLADKLRSMSESLANAADLGAKTAHRLQALANNEVNKVDDADPLESMEALKGVAALTRLANDSSSIALNLLAANKDTVTRLNAPKEEDNDDDARAEEIARRLEARIAARAA